MIRMTDMLRFPVHENEKALRGFPRKAL